MTLKLSPQQKIARARARKGAKFMDKHRSDWWQIIGREAELDMSDGSACILGQVYEGYDYGLETLNLEEHEAKQMGFYVFMSWEVGSEAEDILEPNYSDLREAWDVEIYKRRRKVVAPA